MDDAFQTLDVADKSDKSDDGIQTEGWDAIPAKARWDDEFCKTNDTPQVTGSADAFPVGNKYAESQIDSSAETEEMAAASDLKSKMRAFLEDTDGQFKPENRSYAGRG
jgi:hypothetical protein